MFWIQAPMPFSTLTDFLSEKQGVCTTVKSWEDIKMNRFSVPFAQVKLLWTRCQQPPLFCSRGEDYLYWSTFSAFQILTLKTSPRVPRSIQFQTRFVHFPDSHFPVIIPSSTVCHIPSVCTTCHLLKVRLLCLLDL